ncbi:MAG: hypothetical protein JXQ73_27475 [Phycisphaerae bacterium]|nr:hypothetical protein [Phycisphaerae bacterium]
MGDAAHVGSHKHEIFHKPFEVNPREEDWPTPGNYRRFPGGDKLPEKIRVWRVQHSGKSYGGVVSRSWGYDDSPDAEALVAGYNGGKEHGAVGVGRHGNFLQWGYASPPSKMTGAGRRLFLNCIRYIRRFDGKKPLFRRERGDRTYAVRDAGLINRIKDKKFFRGSFTPEQMEKYKGNPEALVKYYEDNFELIYKDQTYLIDEDLKALGLKSNRKVETLERVIQSLTDEKSAPAAKRVLARYVAVSLDSPEAWKKWFDENRDRIYFTDIGGYKFRVVPKGYLDTPGKAVSDR